MHLLQSYTNSEEETIALGSCLGKQLIPHTVVCFFGELGAGKTACIRGIVSAWQESQELYVSSPTYTYLHVYKGTCPIYHFDLYRLHNASDFIQMGFDEYFYAGGICCIEWAERIQSVLPASHMRITVVQENGFRRKWVIESDEKIYL